MSHGEKRFLMYNHPVLLSDLTDLLYYDAFVNPSRGMLEISDFLRGKISAINNNIEEKLFEANFILSTKEVFSGELLAQIDQSVFSRFKMLLDTGVFKKFRYTTIDPTNEASSIIIPQLSRIAFDETTRHFVNLAFDKGIHVVPRFPAVQFHEAFSEGKNEVLSIIYSHLPSLDMTAISIDTLIDFLKNEETQIKRRRLFAWQNEIEMKIEKGDIRINHVPDLIATCLDDYISWLRKSELKFKYGVYESLLVVATNIISGLTLIGLPNAVKNLIQFKKREIELMEEEMKAPGRELAYIVHTQKTFAQ